MYCPGCGAENEDDRPLCYRCGISLHNLAPVEMRLPALRGEGRFVTILLLLLGAGFTLLAVGFTILFLLAPDPAPLDTPTPMAAVVEPQGAGPIPSPTPTVPVLAAGVTGRIIDRDTGEPVPAAWLIVDEREVVADENGACQIAGLTPGQHVLVAVHPGYAPANSGIVSLGSGEVRSVTVALEVTGSPGATVDPLGNDAVEPGGAPTADDAERLAREQGLARRVVMAARATLRGKYWVNYRTESGFCAAVATLDNEGWALTDEAGEVWRIVEQGGGLALALPAGWMAPTAVPEATSTQVPVEVVATAAALEATSTQVPVEVVATDIPVSGTIGGKIAFLSDRGSPGYGEIYVMNPDGTEQRAVTSGLHLTSVTGGGADWALNVRWSAAQQQFFLNSGLGGRFYRVHSDGSGATLLRERILGFDLSPDGRRVAAAISPNTAMQSEVVIMNVDGTGETLITTGGVRASLGLEQGSSLLGAAWSRDGKRIAFYSHAPDKICMINADGTAPTVLDTQMYGVAGSHLDWSPDSQHLLVTETRQINILRIGTGEIVKLVDDGAHPSWAPDGSWVVLSRPFGGREPQVWKIRSDGTGLTQLTFEGRNCCPVWLPSQGE